MTAEREAVADKIAAARDVSRTEAYIGRLLAETPPITDEEWLHLTRLLTPPDRGDDAAA